VFTVLVKYSTLQSVDITTLELQVFEMMASIYRTWPGTRPVQVTMYEHLRNDGVTIAKLQLESSPVAIKGLEWKYDHISEVLDDRDVLVLDCVT